MSNWLVDKLIPSIMRSETRKSSVPEGLWHKCPSCEAVLYRPELEKTLDVCPKCNHHMRIGARARIDIFLDAEGREELGADLEPVDRLKFRDGKKYKDRLTAAQKQTGEKDALISMSGTLLGMPVVVSAFEFSFMGGSMGAIVGESFVRAANYALENKCPSCEAVLYRPELEKTLDVCPKCNHHMRIGARARIDIFLDADGRNELGADLEPVDRLKFRDSKKYKDRLVGAQKQTGEKDALISVSGKLLGMPVVVSAFEFSFMGGSMGAIVGERFVRAANYALENRCPMICFAASGGARMQEALISLMQMAKTSAVLARLREEGIPFISVLTDPVYGGVSASLAMLGDVIVGEPKALIGFAGPRVIEQTVREKLPEGFQRSEFLLEHGAIDLIIPRGELRPRLGNLLAQMMGLPTPVYVAPKVEPIVVPPVPANL